MSATGGVYPESPAERTRWIRGLRLPVERPHAASAPQLLVESEPDVSLIARQTGIVFLINRECPWTCLMCDLWRHTTPHPLPAGHAVTQLRTALDQLTSLSSKPLEHIKIYNSGSFFDSKAIPPEDYPSMATLLEPFQRVIVECHPALIHERVTEFQRMLKPELEVAMGLEAADNDVLHRLNKRCTMEAYARSCAFLNQNLIAHRAFVMVQPPFVSPETARGLCLRSVRFAFGQGAASVSLIPTRTTNRAMEALERQGDHLPPRLKLLEQCLEDALALKHGRVFADVWDLELFRDCDHCLDDRQQRLQRMNERQIIEPSVVCPHCQSGYE